ncbi:MAG: ABC-type transport system involved in cytochrome c biogenesis permease component [Kiritimatiellia bacterium]|jgi:ABC-type transport system involved in cytochrome c biogenesis permease component
MGNYRLEMPLFRRELLELAEQQRLYWIRAAYLIGLGILYYFLIAPELAADSGKPVQGYGRVVFNMISIFQALAVFFVQPVYAGSAFTEEKEGGTMPLLMASPMSLAQIIGQKYLSRTLPVVSFVFLTMPFYAMAYALGGIATQDILISGMFMLTFSMSTAAIGLSCSARFAHTQNALIHTYVRSALSLLVILPFREWAIIPGLIVTMAFLFRCWQFLPRYAFPPPGLDERSDREGEWGFPYRKVFKRRKPPRDHPVTWREVQLFRAGVKLRKDLMTIVATLCTMMAIPLLFSDSEEDLAFQFVFYGFAAGIWLLIALDMLGFGSATFNRDRQNGVLALLLASPITAKDIILQKVKAQHTWTKLTLASLSFVYLIRFLKGLLRLGEVTVFDVGLTALASVLSMAIFSWFLCWFGVLLGLLIRQRIRALVTAIGILLASHMIPHVRVGFLEVALAGYPGILLEDSPWEWAGVYIALLVYLMLAEGMRRYCLSRARTLLESMV